MTIGSDTIGVIDAGMGSLYHELEGAGVGCCSELSACDYNMGIG